MRRLYIIITALTILIVNARAQSLSVTNIEAQTGEETTLVVSLTGGTSMTALQFNLSLPEGVTLTTSGDTYGITLGTATDGHTLEVETLSNGDLLFILYNTEQKAFKSGELLRIPITVGSTAIEANGKLYTVRTATADAVSHTCADVSFSVIVPIKKCATPTISFANGKVKVTCATEGAKCVTNIVMAENQTSEDGEIDVSPAFMVNTYATAEGYADSEVVTATFSWPKTAGDLNEDGHIDISDVTTLVNIILGK